MNNKLSALTQPFVASKNRVFAGLYFAESISLLGDAFRVRFMAHTLLFHICGGHRLSHCRIYREPFSGQEFSIWPDHFACAFRAGNAIYEKEIVVTGLFYKPVTLPFDRRLPWPRSGINLIQEPAKMFLPRSGF
jgi:hypothetical protein